MLLGIIGKTYNTVQVVSQCWLKENLDVGMIIDVSNDATNNGTIEKYCYDNDPANCTTYGGFYQWDEAMQYVTTEGTQGICPAGWHIPTKAEYETLQSYASDEAAKLVAVGEPATAYTPNNETGFSALLAGTRSSAFFGMGEYTKFWSSTENIVSHAWNNGLYGTNVDVSINTYWKYGGRSVRCLKD